VCLPSPVAHSAPAFLSSFQFFSLSPSFINQMLKFLPLISPCSFPQSFRSFRVFCFGLSLWSACHGMIRSSTYSYSMPTAPSWGVLLILIIPETPVFNKVLCHCNCLMGIYHMNQRIWKIEFYCQSLSTTVDQAFGNAWQMNAESLPRLWQ
jgi:hypothetical protein